MLAYTSRGLLLRTENRTPARPVPAPALKRVLILEQRARGPDMGRHATRQAGRRQGEVAADQLSSAGKKRQESTDTVAASLVAGSTISLAFEHVGIRGT